MERVVKRFALLLAILIFSIVVFGQEPLFRSDDVLQLVIAGDIRAVLKDRGNNPLYHPFTLNYESNGEQVVMPVRIRTRGHFRKSDQICYYPPLLLNFAKKDVAGTVFSGSDKLKLVTPCQGEEYVVREYLVYRLYNLITPKSFRVRLVKVIYDDTGKGKQSKPLYGFLLEEDDQMARRNKAVLIEKRLIRPEQTQADDFLTMAMFQFMIGNTDWSIQYRQNIKLIATDSLAMPSPVPYDFDHAGIVGAPYARPAEELKLTSTRERRYRGYCVNELGLFAGVIERFNELKPAFYKLYSTTNLVDNVYKSKTLRYLDEFYELVNDPRKSKEALLYPCRKDGTGNVVIKGLKQ
ncbi:MAG: hypothetical protein HRU69_11100 [Flammeovirgaceae bacterium]|nr:MAG: hypothetical protein HRU69_11100 [Flammeovirgaceae bacterium]